MASLTGRLFGHYHVLEIIGRGGVATVYRALDRKANQEVAVKFVSPALAETDEFLKRFRREVKVVARLEHPHILPVLDYGEQDGYAYLVMPLVKQGSLADRLDRGKMSLQEGGKLLAQVASALSYAHQRGLVHRDVKPSNILLDDDGNALLADFGLARPVEQTLSLTGSGVIGTPAYMSPEQIHGGKVDARSDQYALGVLLFQLATGTLPFEADTPMGYLLKHVNEEFPSARQRNPNVPKTIERVIQRATVKQPSQRFESVADMNQALQASLAHLLDPQVNRAPTVNLPPSLKARLAARRRRRAMLVTGAIAGSVVLVLSVPVLASGLVGLLERAQSPAEGSNSPASAAQLTAQAGTIEAMSTALASTSGPGMSADEIGTAVVMTIAAQGGESDLLGAPESGPGSETPTATITATPTTSGTPAGTAQANTPPPSPSPVASQTPLPPGLTPSATATPTRTPTRTITPTPSATRTPTASPSATFTFTATPTLAPTATQNPCDQLSLGGFGAGSDRVWWNLNNGSTVSMSVSRLALDWPASNGALDRIRFNNGTRWNGHDESPPSDISSGWTGATTIPAGSVVELAFQFSGATAGSGYSLDVYLGPGCQQSAGG